MFRIRFHGRGGQGIKTASQILGSAFFRSGFEVQDAPRYGAERRGAPIFAYVRAGRAPIQERGVILRPDLVVVADDSLIPVPAAGVLEGVTPRTVLLVNSALSPEQWQQRLKLNAPILCLPAGLEIEDRAGIPPIGAICAGAAARLVGAIALEALAQALEEELARLGDRELERNRSQALAAFDALASNAGRVKEGESVQANGYAPPEWIDLDAEAAVLAAPDVEGAATSERAKTGLWRTLRPVIDYARCNGCSWICGTLCPDGAIRVEADHTPHIDYDHCKGCMVCVAVCPPHAIAAVSESAARSEESPA